MSARARTVVGMLWAVAGCLALSSGRAEAQVAGGELTGIVTDTSGAAVAGATVTVTEIATSFQRVVVTTPDGVYVVPGLPPGTYQLMVDARIFQQVRREGVRLTTGDRARIDFALAAREVTEAVTVTADAPVLRGETGSLGTLIAHEQVVGLPLNGRTFITLAALSPGVALPPNNVLPRISGGRPRTNEYLYDGISVLQPEPGQVAYFPVIDAIREFKIESNSPPAEFGRFNGGVVNLTTRAGSNALHGSLFEFLRHEALNARNYFQLSSPVKPKYRRQQFGGTLGGPIVLDRTFFFVDYQGQRQSIATTRISTVPTLLQRQGVFTESIAGKVPVIYDPATPAGTPRQPFSSNTIPTGQMDPVALALVERYPKPTGSGTSNNYSRTIDEVVTQNQWDARVDHRFAGQRDVVFGRLSNFREQFDPALPLPDGSGAVSTGTLGPQHTTSWAFASNYQRSVTPNVLNELRVGHTRRTVARVAAQLPNSAGTALGIPGIPSDARFPNTLPTFAVGGYQQLGSPANTASDFNTSVTEVADSLTWVRGRHAFKMGFDWRWVALNVTQPPSPTGLFTFDTQGSDLPGTTGTGNGLASFLLGQVKSFSIDLQLGPIQERARIQEYFVQDDWKVSSRLTVNPGLRYTLNFPSTEINGQTAVFNLDTRELEYPGTNPVRPLKKNNFGPRLSAAYQAADKLVVSAGYGLVWIEMAGITTPFTTPTFPFLQTVSERALDASSPAFLLRNGPTAAPIPTTPSAGLGQGVFAVDATLGSGYVQQWNVAVQRELSSHTAVEVAYLGSRINHVGIPDTNLNQLTPEQLALGNTLLEKVPNPYFGLIPRSSSIGEPFITRAQLLKPYPDYLTVSRYRNNVGTTNYKGLSLLLRRRMSGGLSYSIAYTRSKLIDEASSVFDASILTGPPAAFPVADSFDRARERDYSTGDIPHVFVSSAIWALPFGPGRRYDLHGWLGALASDWMVSAIVTAQSGVPIAITQSTNFNAFAGFGVQRPNLVGEPTLPADERSITRWFNTAAFQAAPVFTLGSASRNPVRGPAYRTVDLAFMRRVPVRGATSVEVRAEIFNLLNTRNWGPPAGILGAANFGTISTVLDPRISQLAVKFLF